MASLNDMVLQLSSTNDTKKKLTIGQDIIDHLGQPENSVECDDLGGFIDTLVPFMQSSNFKVFMFIIKFVLFSILQSNVQYKSLRCHQSLQIYL